MSRGAGAAWARAALTFAVVVGADQGTKALVRGHMGVGGEDSILPAVTLVNVRNNGIAFGLFEHGGLVLAAVTAAALALLLVYFARHLHTPLAWLPTGLLLGGAAGNILDRVRDGAVTDFIKLPAWPAFNLADVSITVGVLALLWVIEGASRDSGDAQA